MSEQKIKFSIGTEFNGEGMLKAREGIQQLNRSAGQTAGALNQFANAFGGIDTKCATATKAITGALNAFVSLNPVVLGVTAATAALTWGIEQCNKKQEEAEARANALKASLVKLWDVGFNPNLLKTIAEEMKKVSAEFDRTTKLANSLEAAMTKMKGAKGANEIAQLEVEKANASFEALDEAQRQITEAYYDAEIAQKKLDQTKQQQADAIDSATKSVNDAESRLQITRDSISKMNDELAKLNEQYEWIYGNEEAEKDIKKRITDVENAIATAKTEEESRLNDLKVAIINEQTARTSATTAISNAEAAVTKAIQKQYAVEEALEKRKEAEEMTAETARQEADAAKQNAEQQARQESFLKQLNEALEADIKTQSGLNNAKEKLKQLLEESGDQLGDGKIFEQVQKAATKMLAQAEGGLPKNTANTTAQRNYQQALNNYNANLQANEFNKAVNNWQSRWGLDAFNPRANQKAVGEAAVQQARGEGKIRTSADEHNIRMAAKRAMRDYESSKEARQIKADERERQRLEQAKERAERNGRKLNDRDQKKLDNLNANRDARNKAQKELAAAEKAKNEEAQNIQKMKDDVKELKDFLKTKLGLK